MAKNFYQRVPLDDSGEAVVHVNRRGCKGRWTKQDDEMLKALVRAAQAMQRDEKRTAGEDGP